MKAISLEHLHWSKNLKVSAVMGANQNIITRASDRLVQEEGATKGADQVRVVVLA